MPYFVSSVDVDMAGVTALIVAAAGLVTAITALVKAFQHDNSIKKIKNGLNGPH